MDLEERLDLIAKEPTEEIVVLDELKQILQSTSRPRHYIGLEISGLLHLGSLVITGYKINDFLKAQIDCNVFLADWHTYINNKLDGDWEKIKKVSDYYSQAFKFFCPGVNIILGSSLYDTTDDYWKNFVLFCKHMSLSRIMRALTIMGRTEKETLDFSQLLYPSMQSSDIKALDLDIVHAGMDQRKIHMLVREIFPKLGWKVPVSVHHHLLPGLSEPRKLADDDKKPDHHISSKMSKTKPMSGILIHDEKDVIEEKILRAYCPVGVVENNPILEIIRYVIYPKYSSFEIERPAKYGGTITYYDPKILENDFVNKRIHPLDVKKATSRYLDDIIDPIRNHFKGKKILKN